MISQTAIKTNAICNQIQKQAHMKVASGQLNQDSDLDKENVNFNTRIECTKSISDVKQVSASVHQKADYSISLNDSSAEKAIADLYEKVHKDSYCYCCSS
jgi:hypothetical protein